MCVCVRAFTNSMCVCVHVGQLGALLLEKKEQLRKLVSEASTFPLLALPDVCVMRVLSFVGPRELGRLAQTCKQLERMTRDPSLWERHAAKPAGCLPPPVALPLPGALVATSAAAPTSCWSCATPRELCRLEDCPYPRNAIRRIPLAVALPALKVCLCGASGVGKSALLIAFERGAAQPQPPETAGTLGINFVPFAFEEEDVAFALHVWDMGGEERDPEITAPFYRGIKGVVLVYARDNRRSFERLAEFAALPDQFLPKSLAARPRLFVVGCKADRQRAVGLDEARTLSQRLGATFLGEVSAITPHRVDDALLCVAHQLFRRSKARQQSAPTVVGLASPPPTPPLSLSVTTSGPLTTSAPATTPMLMPIQL